MKYLLVTNVITNGGDYLIASCGREVVYKFISKEECSYLSRCDKNCSELNLGQYDAMIYIGGPLYEDRLLTKNAFPLLHKMKELKKRIFFLGCGWYGSDGDHKKVYGFKFSDEALEMLKYVDETGILGCRDHLTARILKNNGLSNVMMTGCPAWYSKPEEMKVLQERGKIKKVVISDAGLTKNPDTWNGKYSQMVSLIEYVCQKFENAEILFTFNNGINTKYSCEYNNRVREFLVEKGIEYFDLSNSCNGFKLYDDCDIHIGYRVHSHIYSLTRNIPSILICEDARGAGLNETLGLEVIKANVSKKEGCFISNPCLINQLKDVVEETLEQHTVIDKRITDYIEFVYKTSIKDFFIKVISEKKGAISNV